MSAIDAIVVENLGKRYRLGTSRSSYPTLRDTLMAGLRGLRGRRPPAGEAASPEVFWALRDVSLRIAEGDILGIIGRNGAGKTTLLKVLCRITEPTEGRVTLTGRVGALLEVGSGFHPELTGRDNIYLNGAILGMTRREIRAKFDDIVTFADIGPFLDTPLKRYSTGMGTRLAFAIAAHLDTDILLVDEVLAVGDLGFRQKCLGKMQDVTQAGRTVLFVSHELNAVRRLCRQAVWLDQGRVRALGGVQEVVGAYEASFLDAKGQRPSRVERPQPPSSPHWFAWAALTDAQGQTASIFPYQGTLRLLLGLSGRSHYKEYHIEWYLFDRQRGNRVAWGATYAVPQGFIPVGADTAAFVLGPLPLAAGEFSLSLRMLIPHVAELDMWHDAITFSVTGSDPDGAGYHYTTEYAPVVIPYHLVT